MTVSETRQLGRGKNAVLTFLEKRLVVPKIYLDAEWAGEKVDVLAIDRDGVGDVHAVLLLVLDLPFAGADVADRLTALIDPVLKRFEVLPAQYKYVAVVDDAGHHGLSLPGLPHLVNDHSFSPDGIGRVGFLAVDVSAGELTPTRLLFKPERFRAKIAKLADEYVQQHEADWEIRA